MSLIPAAPPKVDQTLPWLARDLLAGAKNRSPLLITGSPQETRRLTRLMRDLGDSLGGGSRYAVISPEALAEDLAGFSVTSLRPAAQKRPWVERWTLCLENIDRLDAPTQSLLHYFLDVLYASEGPRRSVWVISTATSDLAQQVARSRFRPDLFYRLNLVNTTLVGKQSARLLEPSLLAAVRSELGHDRANRSPGGAASLGRRRDGKAQPHFTQLQPLLASLSRPD